MMDLYLVVSEGMTAWESHYEPPEWYCIAELMVARNRSQARYLAWKADRNSFSYDFGDMPKFKIRLRIRDFPGSERVVSEDYDLQTRIYERWPMGISFYVEENGTREPVYEDWLWDLNIKRVEDWDDIQA